MVSKSRLKAIAKENGFSLSDLAEFLGLTYGTFVARLNRGYLRSNDIEALIAILGLEAQDYEPVFFDRLNDARKLAKY